MPLEFFAGDQLHLGCKVDEGVAPFQIGFVHLARLGVEPGAVHRRALDALGDRNEVGQLELPLDLAVGEPQDQRPVPHDRKLARPAAAVGVENHRGFGKQRHRRREQRGDEGGTTERNPEQNVIAIQCSLLLMNQMSPASSSAAARNQIVSNTGRNSRSVALCEIRSARSAASRSRSAGA